MIMQNKTGFLSYIRLPVWQKALNHTLETSLQNYTLNFKDWLDTYRKRVPRLYHAVVNVIFKIGVKYAKNGEQILLNVTYKSVMGLIGQRSILQNGFLIH